MQVADFDYDLPPELIAQQPAAQRSASRLLALDRRTGQCELNCFTDFPDYLEAGDCLVLNDSKVIPARLYGARKSGGGKVEALLLEELEPGLWEALLRPGRRLPPATEVKITGAEASFEVVSRRDEVFQIRFRTSNVLDLLTRCGKMPLPPYIHRSATGADTERYQTVYAEKPGAVAAPTAGLHFTPEVLQKIESKGVSIVRLTLHVGLATFQPVSAERVENHAMSAERYLLPVAAAETINAARAQGGRVVAVGTTSVRVLETCAGPDGRVRPGTGRTSLFIFPPYEPRAVDALLTNFHLPRSTLLMLVSAFAGRERVLTAYELAVRERFRFYSYGDCMFLH